MWRLRLTQADRRLRSVALVAAFGLLSTLSHPRFRMHFLGWVALVPLLVLLRGVPGWHRAANRGISCIIDARGRVAPDRVRPDDPDGIIVATVPLVEGGTPYVAAGDWPSYLALAATAAGVAWRVRRRWRERVVSGPVSSLPDINFSERDREPERESREAT